MALPIDLDGLLAHVDALRDEIDAMRPLTPEQAGRAMQRLRIEWTYHSNAIEGNSLTYGETRALLMHGVTAHGKPLKDHLDIRRHREVIEYLEAFVRSDEPLTLTAIREMHRMLMGDTYEVSAETPNGERVKREVRGGEFKTLPNNVVTETGETHYYTSPQETPAAMTDLLDGLRQSSDALPVVRAALFHHAFVEIHPFPDGNGRTARVLMNLLLMRAGYIPAVVRQERRPAYYGALAAADGGDRQPTIQFVAEELAETMELYLRALRGEPDPSAFDRRLAILKREAKGIPPSDIGQAERAEIGMRFLIPLFAETDRRVAELAALFGGTDSVTKVTGSDGKLRVNEEATPVLREGEWVSLSPFWRLLNLSARPGFNATVRYDGGVEGSDFILRSGRAQWAFAVNQLPGSEHVSAVADAVFSTVLDEIEKSTRGGRS